MSHFFSEFAMKFTSSEQLQSSQILRPSVSIPHLSPYYRLSHLVLARVLLVHSLYTASHVECSTSIRASVHA